MGAFVCLGDASAGGIPEEVAVNDIQREELISHNYQKLVNAKTKKLRVVYFYFLRQLILTRSKAQIERMESTFDV